MAYDEFLAERISRVFKDKHIPNIGKKMMGGFVFMVDDKMCVGVVKNDMMVRLDPEIQEEAMTKPGCRPMDFTKRPMKGYVFVSPEGVDMDIDLEYWIDLALEYNPRAKASKKKR